MTDRQTFQICSRRGGWGGDWCVERARRPAPEGWLWRRARPAAPLPRPRPGRALPSRAAHCAQPWRQCAFTQKLNKSGMGKGNVEKVFGRQDRHDRKMCTECAKRNEQKESAGEMQKAIEREARMCKHACANTQADVQTRMCRMCIHASAPCIYI